MPCIVNFKTKKEFKQAVKDGQTVIMENPSMFEPYYGSFWDYMEVNKMETFTNHPKRSWFASVTNKQGKLIVK